MKKLNKISILALIAVGAVAVYLSLPRFVSYAKQPSGATALWQAKLPDQTGRMQLLAQYRGSPLLVNFWAPWCGPCQEEIPVLSALLKEYAPKDLHLIGIAVDSAAKVEQFTKKVAVDYPLYIAGYEGLELARALGNLQGGLPFTVLIDASGKIRATVVGSIKLEGQRLEELRQQLDVL